MDEHYFAVIMAGGGGTRLWPLSRQQKPKQMLQLFGERTLYQMAIQRLEGLFAPDHIFVVTVAEQAMELMKQVPQIPAKNFLMEPLPRGTASVVGLAAVALQHRDPEAVMAVLTADHFIKDEARFRELLAAGLELAQNGHLVTLGISPTYPATGYGYIQRGEGLGKVHDMPAFKVQRFKEKPEEPQAREMIANGDHDWNSGMFIWKVERILEEIKAHMPELATKLEKISDGWGTPQCQKILDQVWPTIHPETIDYGVMERANQVAVLPAADLGWNDVGSWDSLFDVLESDQNGNIVLGTEHIGIDTSQTLVTANNPNRLIVTIGVKDLVIIDTGDALLVCNKEQAQDVKKVVNLLKESHQHQYL